jgi:hypothetical protein
MAIDTSCGKAGSVAKAKRILSDRARSVPHKQPYVRAVFLSAVHYMGILAAATTLVVFILNPSHRASQVLIGCIVFIALTWLLALFKRRSTHCPLCKGTPLINSGALAHQKATRIFPFNHGVSAILCIIATQKFRCMYCGTAFDILKTPAHLRPRDDLTYSADYIAYTQDEVP